MARRLKTTKIVDQATVKQARMVAQRPWPGGYAGAPIADRWQVFELQFPTSGRYAVFDDTIGVLVRDKRGEFLSFNTVEEAESWVRTLAQEA